MTAAPSGREAPVPECSPARLGDRVGKRDAPNDFAAARYEGPGSRGQPEPAGAPRGLPARRKRFRSSIVDGRVATACQGSAGPFVGTPHGRHDPQRHA